VHRPRTVAPRALPVPELLQLAAAGDVDAPISVVIAGWVAYGAGCLGGGSMQRLWGYCKCVYCGV